MSAPAAKHGSISTWVAHNPLLLLSRAVDKRGFILSLLLCRPTRLVTSRPLPCPLPAQVGYVSILNLPMRRAEAKRKLEHTTTAFAQVG